MKKLLVLAVVAVMFFAAGCRERTVYIDGPAVDSLMDSLTITARPDDGDITFIIEGIPDSLPPGFNGVNIYLDTTDISADSGQNIESEPIHTFIRDGEHTHTTLTNGVAYYYAGRADLTDDTVSTLGFGGRFYPRPWGAGSYLGYDPGSGDIDSAQGNALYFNRTTGDAEQRDYADTADFYFALDGTDFVLACKDTTGAAGVAASGYGEEEWLDTLTQQAPEKYETSVPLELGKIYHFKTHDAYYGKLMINTVDIPNLEIEIIYAFQTADSVKNY